jgi:hypothetical protein
MFVCVLIQPLFRDAASDNSEGGEGNEDDDEKVMRVYLAVRGGQPAEVEEGEVPRLLRVYVCVCVCFVSVYVCVLCMC